MAKGSVGPRNCAIRFSQVYVKDLLDLRSSVFGHEIPFNYFLGQPAS